MNEQLINICLYETSKSRSPDEVFCSCYTARVQDVANNIQSSEQAKTMAMNGVKKLEDILYLIKSESRAQKHKSGMLTAILIQRGANKLC